MMKKSAMLLVLVLLLALTVSAVQAEEEQVPFYRVDAAQDHCVPVATAIFVNATYYVNEDTVVMVSPANIVKGQGDHTGDFVNNVWQPEAAQEGSSFEAWWDEYADGIFATGTMITVLEFSTYYKGTLVSHSSVTVVCHEDDFGPPFPFPAREVTIVNTTYDYDFGAPATTITDGRVNRDPAAPTAIYTSSQGVSLWVINPETSEGSLLFDVPQSLIDEMGIPETGAVLLAEGVNPFNGFPAQLYRLSTGEFQLNTFELDEVYGQKPYVLIWRPGGTPRRLDQ